MATISNAQAVYGLQATATATGTNVTGELTVGLTPAVMSFSAATKAYSFRITAATTDNTVGWTLTTGATAAGAGSPIITDGDGKDAEGQDIADITDLYAVLIKASPSNTGPITLADNDGILIYFPLHPGAQFSVFSTTVISPWAYADVMTIGMGDTGNVVDIVVIGA